ncbi:hypothetical protein BJY52DRAFT_1206158 [Lactarius psammicola]|nr:hypothetical protein BJY52DRAFT_1206158 [Lactarius psammicola]
MTTRERCRAVSDRRQDLPMVDSPLGISGAVRDGVLGLDNIWTPFQSQCDWEFARWAKNRGPTSTAVGELLAIDGVVENLGLSYRNMRELNRIINNEMPAQPRFRCEEVEIGGENFEFYFREVVPCLRTLFGDPEFAKRLVFAPECHYQDSDHTVRVFSEMHTGKWWWSVQQSLEAQNPGTTVLPIIISSDKTQLTHFRNKSAYPVYLSIGNIPKDLRHKHIPNKAARRRALANLFHKCMHKILSPIESYGKNGIAMVTSDGTWYRCHPVLAAVIGDYPEQCLVTCTYNGQCPKCSRFPLRDFKTAVSIFALANGNPTIFNAACQEAHLKPTYHPFWEQFPYTNIFLSITPDILHQIHQGVTKHLIRWLSTLGSEEIDARCIRLPPSHNACSFPRGITSLSKLTSREHRDICRVLMGVVVDLRLPIRAILDFIYISQYRVHTVETLNALDDALQRFHDNKEVFIDIGAREHFNIPKFHSLLHYSRSITLFGTADNYNTEQVERLHIDFTKNAYRVTNHKDEYPQMTTWLERQEAIQQQTAFIEWRRLRPVAFSAPTLRLHPLLAIHPSEKGISFEGLALRYRARDFQDALADFIVRHNFPGLSPAAARRRADNTLLPFRCMSVFHKIKFSDSDSEHSNIADVIHIKPERQSQHRALIPGRFDTALVMSASKYRVVQIRVVFRLPKQVASSVFTGSCPPPTDLAYVKWFSPLTPASGGSHGMFRTSRSYHNGQRLAGIIPLADICWSVQLFLVFGPFAPWQWHGSTVLEDCNSFYINPFLDEHIYKNLNVINQNL